MKDSKEKEGLKGVRGWRERGEGGRGGGKEESCGDREREREG